MISWRTHTIVAYALLGVMVITNFHSQLRMTVYTSNSLGFHTSRDLARQRTKYNGNSVSRRMSPTRVDVEKFLDPFNAKSCACSGKRNYGPVNDTALNRQKVQFEEWKKSRNVKHDPVVICPAMSPLTFVGGGLRVEPLHSIKLMGLTIDEQIWNLSLQNRDFDIRFTATKSLGVLETHSVQFPNILLTGNGTHVLLVQILPRVDLGEIQTFLENISYRSTKYDIELRDVVEVSLQGNTLEMNIHIRREPLPKFYNVGITDHISNKVTIVTKTFQRQKPIARLIESVRMFYPNLTVIVADDSAEPIQIDDPYTKHYTMPFAEGWFAGRNLALSQVRTEYFLWVDDDFVFTENTVLEKLLERLEAPHYNLDLVAGILDVDDFADASNTINTWHKIYSKTAGDSGYCLEEIPDHYGSIEGLPECSIADAVINFFMANTEAVRNVGFDPTLERVGHFEFFLDGLGLLRIAICSDVKAIHRPEAGKNYYNYRYTEDLGITKYEDRVMYSTFRHNLNCAKGIYRKPVETVKVKT